MSPFAWENDVVEVPRGPEPGGLGGAYRAFGETLRGLRTTVERVAAGPFAREAIAEVRNAQFIEFCRAVGDEETAKLYLDIIHPEEIYHHEMGSQLLGKYALTDELQELAAAAMRSSLAIADELRTLTEKATGMRSIPVS